MQEEIKKIKKKISDLKTYFDNYWRPYYLDLAEYIYPARSLFLDARNDIATKKGADKSEYDRLKDNSGTVAMELASAGIYSGLTPPAKKWGLFRLREDSADDIKINKSPEVLEAFQRAEVLFFGLCRRSKFYDMLRVAYMDILTFGTCCISVEPYEVELANLEQKEEKGMLSAEPPKTDRGLICRNIPPGEYLLEENHRGEVDTVIRLFALTSRNVVALFGLDNVSMAVKQNLQNGSDNLVTIAHFVAPNKKWDDSFYDSSVKKKFVSIYFEYESQEPLKPLRVSGFDIFPYVTARDLVMGGEPYGRGLGMKALPDIKMLQSMTIDKLTAINKIVDPPLQVDSSLLNERVNTNPGAINYVPNVQGAGAAITPLYNVNVDLDKLETMIYNTKKNIERTFFTDLFLMLSGETIKRNVTAAEVVAKQQEKAEAIGPLIERLIPELILPTVNIILSIMRDWGYFNDFPESTAGKEVEVELISVLAQAQKYSDAALIEQAIAFTNGVATLDPNVRFKIRGDGAVSAYVNAIGAPATMIVGDEEYADKIEEQAQLINANQTAQMAEQMGRASQSLSAAKTGDDNMLTGLLGGQQG